MKPIPFQRKLKVKPEHLDIQNHVNNLEYMKWVIDISETHWNVKTPEDIKEKYAWYVLEHHIQYKKQAFLGDELVVTTWIEKCSKVKSERLVRITRECDGKLVAEAKTNWCFIDRQTRKPTLIIKEVLKPFFEFESA